MNIILAFKAFYLTLIGTPGQISDGKHTFDELNYECREIRRHFDTLREQIASTQHDIWASSRSSVLSSGEFLEDGRYALHALSSGKVRCWQRQIDMPYADLSESEKDQDREQADKVLAHILPHDDDETNGPAASLAPVGRILPQGVKDKTTRVRGFGAFKM